MTSGAFARDWCTFSSVRGRLVVDSTFPAMAVSGSGLSTRASAFSKALQLELGILLDHTDDGYQRDWRKLVHKLGLTKDYDNIHKQTRRTEAILRIWSCEKPQDSNGRELVKALIDMGRTDAATAVEYHLGEEYDPTANATEDLFSVLDRAAKLGNVEALTEQLGSSKVRSSRQV